MLEVIISLKNSVVNLLKQQSQIKDLVHGVFCKVPANTKFPYIYVDSNKVNKVTTNTSQALKIELIVAIFDQSLDNERIYQIAKELESLLSSIQLKIENLRIIHSSYHIEDVRLDKNGVTQQLNIYLSYFVEVLWECIPEV